jgi:hypothetical protein
MGMLKTITGDGGAGQPGHHEDQEGGPRGRSQAPFHQHIFYMAICANDKWSKGSVKQ